MIIEVCDMRGAGKPGYVAKIDDRREKRFLSAKSYSSHGASAKQISYEILEDGIYEVCDANYGGRKRKIHFVLIQDGEDIFWSESLREVESHADHLAGKIESWAVAPEESMISSRTVAPSYPGLKTETEQQTKSVDVVIRCTEINGKQWFQVSNSSDRAFKFFMPDLKQRCNGRKWNGVKKVWEVPQDSALMLRKLIQDYTVDAGNLRIEMTFDISSEAKQLMAMEG